MSRIADQRVASRYASALFAAAAKLGSEANVSQDLSSLVELWAATPLLRKTLESPVVAEKEKHRILDEVFSKEIEPLSLAFLHLLMKKRRESILEPVREEFNRRYDASRKLVRAEAIVAAPLDAAEQAALVAALEARTGSKIEITISENSEILGGVVVRMGGDVLDGSVRGSLERFRTRMLAEL